MSYAKGTSVPIERTRSEIERLVTKAGADSFASAFANHRARIQFRMHGFVVRFELDLGVNEVRTKSEIAKYKTLSDDLWNARAEAERRRRWRALLLGIKAKLEMAESGIELFESVFLANIVMPDGSTVGDQVIDTLSQRLKNGDTTRLMLGPG